MRWKTGRRSRNIEDRRGAKSSFPRFPSGGGSRRGLKRGGGLSGGVILIIIVIGLITGQNPLEMLGMIAGSGSGSSSPVSESQGVPLDPSANDEDADFVSAVLADTEDAWQALSSQAGSNYQAPS
jgi:uncharacterized protein